MRILNAMFGRDLGGIEQAFVDYSVSLEKLGNEVIALIRPNASVAELLPPTIPILKTKDIYYWGTFGHLKLRSLIKQIQPTVIITHGNRATSLLRPAARGLCPIVGVVHNYSFERLVGMDAVIAITEDLYHQLAKAGQKKENLYHIPNMIFAPKDLPERAHHHPPVIGAMGRLIKKKGFSFFLWSLAELKKKDIAFRAIIAGDGEEMDHLKKLARTLQLEDVVQFPGWITDKTKFFQEIDIFCVPSLHEPFGIVLLEAFYHKVPVIATDTEGPMLIIESTKNGVIVPRENVFSMFSALKHMIEDRKFADSIAKQARLDVEKTYDSRIVSRQIQAILEKTIKEF